DGKVWPSSARQAARLTQRSLKWPRELWRSPHAALRRLAPLPLQPPLNASVLADGDVEPHPRRAPEMRTEDGAGREHDAVALRSFRECQRVLDIREARPNEHAVRRLHEQLQPHAFEHAHDIEPRLTEAFAQSRQVFAVVAVDQHQMDDPLGKLRGGDAG